MSTDPANSAEHATQTSGAALAALMVLATMFAFAVMDGLTKILSQTLPIPQIMWVRNIVFASLVLSMMLAQRRPLRELAVSRRPWLQASRAALLAIESGLFMLAFKLMPIADVHAVNAAAPLLVVALSVPLLGEQVGWRRWSAVLAGFAGVLLIVRPGFTQMQPAVLIALLGAAMWAAYQIMVRMCARVDSPETTSLWTAVIGLAMTSLVGPAVWVWPDATGWMLLGAIALLGTLAHVAFIRALGMTEPSRLQPYNYTLFVWAVVVGYLFFGDVPDAWTFAGAAIIIASGLYAWHRERVRKATSAPASSPVS
jgi:drug/metabolite transporter (DMT)-like permease